MTNKKKALLALVAVVVASAATLTAKYAHEGQPYNKGKCFIDSQETIGIIVADADDTYQNKDGTKGAYLIQMQGLQLPISMRGTAAYRKFNASMKDKSKFFEVNCETGEPVAK